MPIIILDFKTSGFVLKSIPLVSISCYIYLLKNPHWQNILEFPISSLRRYIGNITFIKLSFLNELTYRDELGTILKIFFSRFLIYLVQRKRRWTFLKSEKDNKKKLKALSSINGQHLYDMGWYLRWCFIPWHFIASLYEIRSTHKIWSARHSFARAVVRTAKYRALLWKER